MMAKQKAKAEEKAMAKKKVEERVKEKPKETPKRRPPHFADEPFFTHPIGELKRSPTFSPGRPLKEQIRFDRLWQQRRRDGVRPVKKV